MLFQWADKNRQFPWDVYPGLIVLKACHSLTQGKGNISALSQDDPLLFTCWQGAPAGSLTGWCPPHEDL